MDLSSAMRTVIPAKSTVRPVVLAPPRWRDALDELDQR